jgi:hypothetical protein
MRSLPEAVSVPLCEDPRPSEIRRSAARPISAPDLRTEHIIGLTIGGVAVGLTEIWSTLSLPGPIRQVATRRRCGSNCFESMARPHVAQQHVARPSAFSASILLIRRLRCGKDTREHGSINVRFRTPPFADRHETTTIKDITAKLV